MQKHSFTIIEYRPSVAFPPMMFPESIATSQTNHGSCSTMLGIFLKQPVARISSASWVFRRAEIIILRSDLNFRGIRMAYNGETGDFDVGIRDANAENIRRKGREREPSFPQPQSRRSLKDSKQWDYDSGEESQKKEVYGFDEDGLEIDDELSSNPFWLFLQKIDMKSAIVLIGFAVPVIAVIGPWIIGNPMGLLTLVGVFLAIQKKFNFWQKVLEVLNFSKFKPKKRKYSRARKMKSKFRSSSSSSNSEETSMREANMDDENQNYQLSGRINNYRSGNAPIVFGGWDELVDEEIYNRVPKKQRNTITRPREERPLFWRIVLALFPFLNFWGGFL